MNPVFSGVYTISEWAVMPSNTSAKPFLNDHGALENSTVGTVSKYFQDNTSCNSYCSAEAIALNLSASWSDLPALQYTRLYMKCSTIHNVSEVDLLINGNCIIQISDDSNRVYTASGAVIQDVSKNFNLVLMPDGNGYALNTLPQGMVAVVRVKFLSTIPFISDTSAGVAPDYFYLAATQQAAIAYTNAKSLPSAPWPPVPWPRYPPSSHLLLAGKYAPDAYSITEWMVLQAKEIPSCPWVSCSGKSWFYYNINGNATCSPLRTSGGLTGPVGEDIYFDVYVLAGTQQFSLCVVSNDNGNVGTPAGWNGATALLPKVNLIADVSNNYSLTFDDQSDAIGDETAVVYPGFGVFYPPENSLIVIRLQFPSNSSFFTPTDKAKTEYTSNLTLWAYGADVWDRKVIQGVMCYPGDKAPPSLASQYSSAQPPLVVTPSAPITLPSNTSQYALQVAGKARNLTWSSADLEIVTVDASTGLLKPGKNAAGGGSTTVTVTAGATGPTGAVANLLSIPVTITPAVPLVTAISISQTTVSIVQGITVSLLPNISPSAAAAVPLAWSSNNPGVVTVSQTGVATANSHGNAIITVVVCDGSNVTATIPVNVFIPVTSISIGPTGPITATVTGPMSLKATVGPSDADIVTNPKKYNNAAVTWTTQNWNVATVDKSTGVVTVANNGSTVITATAVDGSGVTASVTVNVALAVQGISINPPGPFSATVAGATAQFSAAVSPPTALKPAVSWMTTQASVATVDDTGLVTIIGNGNATIKAVAQDGSGVTATIPVTVAIPPVSIAFAASSIVLQTAQTTTPVIATSPPGTPAVAVNWTITKGSAFATINSSSGALTGVAAGAGTLTATAQTVLDQTTGKLLSITVPFAVQTQPVLAQSVAITSNGAVETTLQLVEGTQSPPLLTAQVLPATASQACTWKSSRPDMVAVNGSGLTATLTVLTVGDGKAVTITATTNDAAGMTGAVNVVVTPAPTGITLSPATMSLKGVGATGAAFAVAVQPVGAGSLPVSWSSDNIQAATVNAKSGIITAIAAGSTNITASAVTADGTKKLQSIAAMVTVTVPVLATAITLTPNTPQTVLLTDAAPVFSETLTPTKPDITTCQWSESSNGAVATINEQGGQVTLVGPGTTTITVSTTDGSNLSAHTTLTVVSRVTGIAFSESTVTLDTSTQSYTPGVVITPSNATNQNLSWTSSAPEVASVDPILGIVTPLADGSATVTARSTDGGTVTATFSVAVNSSGNHHKNQASGPAVDRKHKGGRFPVKIVVIIAVVLVVLGALLAGFLMYRKKHRVMSK